MSQWIVEAQVELTVEFENDEVPNEKSAEYVASAIGLSIFKEGVSRSVGKFRVSRTAPVTILSVNHVDSGLKVNDFEEKGVARNTKPTDNGPSTPSGRGDGTYKEQGLW